MYPSLWRKCVNLKCIYSQFQIIRILTATITRILVIRPFHKPLYSFAMIFATNFISSALMWYKVKWCHHLFCLYISVWLYRVIPWNLFWLSSWAIILAIMVGTVRQLFIKSSRIGVGYSFLKNKVSHFYLSLLTPDNFTFILEFIIIPLEWCVKLNIKYRHQGHLIISERNVRESRDIRAAKAA
jgi:hypothetical protein